MERFYHKKNYSNFKNYDIIYNKNILFAGLSQNYVLLLVS